ncbi:MAG: alpha/beta fold hydrolase [Pseudomonadota bacterium]
MLTVNFVHNADVRTAYQDLGEGECFVLVHGFTGSKLDFQNQMPWFSDTHRVIACDQRGHGDSSNRGPYDFYTLSADLLSFLDKLHIPRCHVLGHSLGGMVVMRALLAQPGRFHSAILMDTAPYAPNLFPPQVFARLVEQVRQHGCESLLAGMIAQPQNAAVKRSIDYLGEKEHWRRIRAKLEAMDADAFADLGELLNDHPSILPGLRAIAQPVTVMVGRDDQPFIAAARDMAETLPNADLQIIPDAGHSPQYENPEAWRAVVENHLARHS